MSIFIIIVGIIIVISMVLYLSAKKEISKSRDSIPKMETNPDDIDTAEVQIDDNKNQMESSNSDESNDSGDKSDGGEIFITCPKCNNKGWKHGTSSMGSADVAHTLTSSLTGKETLDKKGTSKIGFRERGKYGSGEDIWVCNACDSAVKFHWLRSLDKVELIDDTEYNILKSDFEKGTGMEY